MSVSYKWEVLHEAGEKWEAAAQKALDVLNAHHAKLSVCIPVEGTDYTLSYNYSGAGLLARKLDQTPYMIVNAKGLGQAMLEQS